ncbi:MAG: DUF2244 domain-containing protein [Acidiferrobacteraceae bacterium]
MNAPLAPSSGTFAGPSSPCPKVVASVAEGGWRSGSARLPGHRWVIRPNRSLSRGLLVPLMAIYVVMEIGIGVVFLLRGAWLVLPFGGLEIAAIGTILYLLSRHARDYELVVVDERHLKVLKRLGKRRSRYEFQRYWTKVSLRTDASGWYPSRLLVGSHGRFVEVGKWMGEDQRRVFARDLKRIIQH